MRLSHHAAGIPPGPPLVLALALAAAPAAAGSAATENGTFSLTVENDVVANADEGYTNGIRLDYVTPRNRPDGLAPLARRAFGWFTPAEDWYLTFAVGQNLYTPSDLSQPVPDPRDRPYAGFLYGSVGIAADAGDRLDTLALDFGIVGPSALGEETQSVVHRLLRVQDPKGWDFQIRDEVGLRLIYEQKRRFLWDFEPGIFGLQADAAPNFSLALGNVETSASIGLTLRVGDRLDDTYGPPRVRPSVAGPGFFEADGFGWYLFAGAQGRAVAYNIFLDGNLLNDPVPGADRSVDREPLVADLQAGLALQFDSIEIAYTHVFRSAEFEGQDGWAQFGSLNMRVKF